MMLYFVNANPMVAGVYGLLFEAPSSALGHVAPTLCQRSQIAQVISRIKFFSRAFPGDVFHRVFLVLIVTVVRGGNEMQIDN